MKEDKDNQLVVTPPEDPLTDDEPPIPEEVDKRAAALAWACFQAPFKKERAENPVSSGE